MFAFSYDLRLLLAFCVSIAINPIAHAADVRPNVVMILSDDQAWGDYSFVGHSAIQTPRLDELARSGLTFTRGYVPDSLCRPSLATIISGLYPHQHGIVGNDPPVPTSLLAKNPRRGPGQVYRDPAYVAVRNEFLNHADAMTTLPEFLKPHGYRSLQTGKWWEGHFSRGGFDEGMTTGNFAQDGRHGDVGLTIGRTGLGPIENFLDRAKVSGQPFFLWYAPMLPHTPHTPPEHLLAKYRGKTDSLPIAKYWAMCEWFDQTCGQLLDAIDDRGMKENTIVIYVTDNGWINDPKESRYAPRSKRSPYEGGIRTPIMISWPGHIDPKLDEEHLASSIDLVPTVLSLLELDVPERLAGINLADAKAVKGRKRLFGEIFEHDIVAMDDPSASLMYHWVIEGNHKLILPTHRVSEAAAELFDLAKDPAEEHDLAKSKAERVSELTKEVERFAANASKE